MFSVSKPIEFDGKIYQSQHELAKTFNLSITMVSQLKNNPERLKTYITNKIQGKTNRQVKNPYKNIDLIIGDFKVEEYVGQLLEDTGKNAYNSRNRLYKYTCTHCGHIYYDQYSQSKLNRLCICQKHKIKNE